MAKQKFTINQNLVGSINSDGIFEGREKIERPPSSKLGVGKSSKSMKKTNTNDMARQEVLSKKDRQRTANGQIDSTLSTRGVVAPEKEAIQVLEVKRGSKTVTIVRGMSSPMETRKEILKGLKTSLGVGGTLVQGVLEIQGAYAAKTVEALQKKGYTAAKRIG